MEIQHTTWTHLTTECVLTQHIFLYMKTSVCCVHSCSCVVPHVHVHIWLGCMGKHALLLMKYKLFKSPPKHSLNVSKALLYSCFSLFSVVLETTHDTPN